MTIHIFKYSTKEMLLLLTATHDKDNLHGISFDGFSLHVICNTVIPNLGMLVDFNEHHESPSIIKSSKYSSYNLSNSHVNKVLIIS